MKFSIIVAALAVSLLGTGCMTGYYARHERRQMVEQDTLSTPPMTIDDVIALAKDSVSDDVILTQIKATHSSFRLTTTDIRDLKTNGVSNAVINAMIKTASEARVITKRVMINNPYYYYPDYFWDPFPSYYYYGPWYGSAWYGAPHFGARFGGHFLARGRHR